MIQNKFSKFTYKNDNIKYFTLFFILLFSISLSIFYFIEKSINSAELEKVKSNEKQIIHIQADILADEFSMILSDLRYLHNSYGKQLIESSNHDEIAKDWLVFSSEHRIYDQIRFIDSYGNEKIRINLDSNGAFITPSNELQNKKARYYFSNTILLEDESIYISPLDLNIEHGKIEIPYKPMVRFSTPIYDDNGNLQGIIVLNYLAERIINTFKKLSQNSYGEISLLNSNGYWISSKDKSLEWGFMYDERKDTTFKTIYPAEWNYISGKSNQVITNKGLFTSTPVHIKSIILNNDEYFHNQNIFFDDCSLLIVSKVSDYDVPDVILSENGFHLVLKVFKKYFPYFLLIILLSVAIAFIVTFKKRTYSKIKFYSEFDSLTNVYNRRAGIDKFNELFNLNNQKKISFSLCFIDINGLKQVNDTLGHRLGDELIVTAVDVIKSVIRKNDLIIRLGGDEFLLIFNNLTVEESELAWSRILDSYEKINITELRPYLISLSHGIVGHSSFFKSHIDDLIKLADEKMYEEKRRLKKTLNVIR